MIYATAGACASGSGTFHHLFDTLRPCRYTVANTTPEADMSNPATASIPAIHIGDTVTYSHTFIDRHSRYPNDMQSAQGKVRALHTLKSGIVMADIDWNKPGLPKRVNVKNLTSAI